MMEENFDNAKLEKEVERSVSPKGTLWALGSTGTLDDLCFETLRNTIAPKGIVGKDMVLWLDQEQVFLNIKFTYWGDRGRDGISGGLVI